MTKIIAMLVFAIATLAGCGGGMGTKEYQTPAVASSTTSQSRPMASQLTPSARSPSSFASLQPFQSFAKGEGVGVAYEYKNRTKAQFVALLRDKALAKKEMRITCEVLVRQMVEAHPNLPFEGCEGAAAAIENNDDFSVVACQDEMFQRDNWLVVTNKTSSAFGVWHRKCLPDEKVLVYKNQPLVSLMCLNGNIPVVTVATGACPHGYTLIANAWSMQSLPPAIRKKAEELIAAAESRNTQNATNIEAYKTDALSRTLGRQLRREVKIRAPLNADIQVQLRDPQTLKVMESLGVLRLVNGIGKIPLTDEQHTKLVETIWQASFISPAVSGGLPRLWVFSKEWGDECSMNVHGLVP